MGDPFPGANSATLTISDVHCLDEGTYWVAVEDQSDAVLNSSVAFLAVDPRAVVFFNRALGTYPYPATIRVRGLPIGMGAVTVALNYLSHPKPNDLAILLQSPQGQTVLLMAHAGGSDPIPEAAPITLAFDDSSSSQIPETVIHEGIFQPSPYPPIPTLPAPAPPPSYGTTMSALTGATRNPNGLWKLYVYDFGGGTPSVGKIEGSWCLTITPSAP